MFWEMSITQCLVWNLWWRCSLSRELDLTAENSSEYGKLVNTQYQSSSCWSFGLKFTNWIYCDICTPSNISCYTSSSSYYDTHHPNWNPHLVSVLTQAEARLAHLWRTIGRAHSLCTLHCDMYKSSYSDIHHHHIMIYIIIILWYSSSSSTPV